MMKTIKVIIAALLAAVLFACQGNGNSNTNNVNTTPKEKAKEVAGRKNFGTQYPVITPLPCIMIATYDEQQVPNVMMAAWGGQYDFDKIIFTLGGHKTTDNIRLKQAFTVSFATEGDIAESDYFGLASGNKVADKVARVGFTATPSPNVDAPIINEYKLTLECRVVKIEEYGSKGGAIVVGQVVNWSADESILNADGKVDMTKLKPLVFDASSLSYRAMGEQVGKAWNAGKKFQ